MIKALLYCTKAKPYLTRGNNGKVYPSCACSNGILSWHLNGKIVAEVEIDKVEEIACEMIDVGVGYDTSYFTESLNDICKESCLETSDLESYLGRVKGGNVVGYALHLRNPKVFDTPKELSDFCMIDNTVEATSKYRKTQYGHYGELIEKKVFKAPQNMQVVFENGILVNHYCNFPRYKYVLISIQPQHLCKILNGEKTIEVRKQVLNCLKEMCKDEY